MSSPYAVRAAQLPNPRPPVTAPDAMEIERASGYKIVRLILPTSGNASRRRDTDAQRYSGNTIQVLEIRGAKTLGLQLGKGRDFIPVRQGSIIRRDFTQFAVRHFSQARSSTPATWQNAIPAIEVDLLVSYGLTVEYAPETYGMTEAFPTWKGTASTVGVNAVSQLTSQAQYDTSMIEPMPGKGGGIFMVQNLSPATDLYLYSGSAGVFDATGVNAPNASTAWKILPGATLTLPLRSRSSQICLATLAGTCDFQCMCDSWGDTSDLTYGVGRFAGFNGKAFEA